MDRNTQEVGNVKIFDKAKEMLFSKKGKKGTVDMMQILSIVGGVILIGVAVAMGILFLDKFAQVDGVSVVAQAAINDTRDSVTGVIDWFDIIILFAVMAAFVVGGMLIYAYFQKVRR